MADVTQKKEQCLVCCERIMLGAKKCIHCDSYQDWRRHLGISSTTIAMLAALISVTALSAKHIQALFETEYSAIRALVLEVSSTGMLLAAANNGNAPGVVKKGMLSVHGLHGDLHFELTPQGQHFVSAADFKEIELTFDDGPPDAQAIRSIKGPEDSGYVACDLYLLVVNFQSMTTTFRSQSEAEDYLREVRQAREENESLRDQAFLVAGPLPPPVDTVIVPFDDCEDVFAKSP